ncbi:hypothetical protein ACOSP7_002256 [Xanthoceras sorbifolium]
MANSSSTHVVTMLMLFIVVFSLLFVSLQAARTLRGDHDHQAMQSINRDSHALLHELGFDLSRLKHYQKLSSTLHAGSDRVSPGGPDPQHHY